MHFCDRNPSSEQNTNARGEPRQQPLPAPRIDTIEKPCNRETRCPSLLCFPHTSDESFLKSHSPHLPVTCPGHSPRTTFEPGSRSWSRRLTLRHVLIIVLAPRL